MVYVSIYTAVDEYRAHGCTFRNAEVSLDLLLMLVALNGRRWCIIIGAQVPCLLGLTFSTEGQKSCSILSVLCSRRWCEKFAPEVSGGLGGLGWS